MTPLDTFSARTIDSLYAHPEETNVTSSIRTRAEDERLPPGVKKPPTVADHESLLAGLNHDLAGEYQAVLMYTHYSAKLTGPYRRELRAFFQDEIRDEQAHAQFLADKIVALGGEPTTLPGRVPYAGQPREMLEQALKMERQAVVNFAERIGQARAIGEVGLAVALEARLAGETRHKEEIERILAGWNEPNLERARNEDRWQDDGGTGNS